MTKMVIISEHADFDERYTYNGAPIQPKNHFVPEPSYRELVPVPIVDSEEPADIEPHTQQIPVVNEHEPHQSPAPDPQLDDTI